MTNRYDQTRDPRTGRPPQPDTQEKPGDAASQAARARREEREALEEAVNTLDGAPSGGGKDVGGERPEALAQFAESARRGEEDPKHLRADERTAGRPTSNADKHDVATRILHDGAEGEKPDPHAEGVDKLPDRINDKG